MQITLRVSKVCRPKIHITPEKGTKLSTYTRFDREICFSGAAGKSWHCYKRSHSIWNVRIWNSKAAGSKAELTVRQIRTNTNTLSTKRIIIYTRINKRHFVSCPTRAKKHIQPIDDIYIGLAKKCEVIEVN